MQSSIAELKRWLTGESRCHKGDRSIYDPTVDLILRLAQRALVAEYGRKLLLRGQSGRYFDHEMSLSFGSNGSLGLPPDKLEGLRYLTVPETGHRDLLQRLVIRTYNQGGQLIVVPNRFWYRDQAVEWRVRWSKQKQAWQCSVRDLPGPLIDSETAE